jgi:tetratricopeptide (TPR) repeat protein
MTPKKNNPDNRNNLADIVEMAKFYLLNKKYEQALKLFRQAMVVNPNDPEIYYNLGLTLEYRNQLDEAKKMYQQALRLKADHSSAREHLNKLVGIKNE